MIVDFHTHLFPDALAPRALNTMQEDIRQHHGRAMAVFTDGTADGLRRSMAANGIDLSIVLPVATTPKQHTTINRFAQEVSGDGILSFAGIHPLQPDWEPVLEEIAACGFRGIKLHPEFQQFYIDSPEALRVLKKAEKLGLLVTLHTGVDACIAPPVHCTPQRLSRALRALDGSNIIAAHLGGFMMWDDVEKYLVGTPICLDTSVIGGYIPTAQYRRIVRAHGAQRILFASDSPWEDQGHALRALRRLELETREMDLILEKNAWRLLGQKGREDNAHSDDDNGHPGNSLL